MICANCSNVMQEQGTVDRLVRRTFLGFFRGYDREKTGDMIYVCNPCSQARGKLYFAIVRADGQVDWGWTPGGFTR